MSQAGLVDILGSNPDIPVEFITDSGDAIPAGNILYVLGGTGINTAGAGDTLTINLDVPVDETNGGTGQTTYATGDILYASAANTLSKLPASTNGFVLTLAAGIPAWAATPAAGVDSVTGTADRITISGTAADPIVDIAATYVGQTSITTLGTIATGTWEATDVGLAHGGTGASLSDPGADRIMFWDESANQVTWLTAGTGLTITDTTITATGTGNVTGPGPTVTANTIATFNGTGGLTIQAAVPTIDSTGNLSVSASVSGASLSTTVANTSNTASATAFYNAQVAGSTASDAYYKSEISGGQAYTWGLDNSDSDAWVLSASATPGTTNVIRASSAGEINYPLQPAFLAFLGSNDDNSTGDGTAFNLGSITALTEVFDQGGDFVTSGTFTAPVTGRYFIGSNVLLQQMVAGTNTSNNALVTSNASYSLANNGNCFTGNNQYNMSTFADMDAADTFRVSIVASGGAKVVDLFGSDRRTSMWAWLEA